MTESKPKREIIKKQAVSKVPTCRLRLTGSFFALSSSETSLTSTRLYGVKSQKIVLLIATAVRTSNQTYEATDEFYLLGYNAMLSGSQHGAGII
jgi:hypothetical protein